MNYHDPRTWQDYDSADQASMRLQAIRNFIPADVHSILDAGCGNGLITNELVELYDVCGIDSSAEALKYLKCPSQQASVTLIPYPDKRFDLVMCNEVLEHLDDKSLQKAIAELKRVSAKYLLISVPDREQLTKLHTRCAQCGLVEHPYGHLQSLSLAKLNEYLAPGFSHQQHLVFGPPTLDFIPWLLSVKQQACKQWFSPYAGWACSKCGSTLFETRSSIFTKALNGINRAIVKPRPFWLLALYSRESKA